MADPTPAPAPAPAPVPASTVQAPLRPAFGPTACRVPAPTGACGPIDAAAWRLYLDVLEAGGRIAADAVPAQRQHVLAGLLRTGLLVSDGLDGSYLAVNPRFVADTLSTEMNTEATRLLNLAERLAADLDPLIAAYDSVPRPAEPVPADHQLTGREHIRQRIAQLGSTCREEALTSHPGPLVAAALELSLSQDLPILHRGCRILTLYRPTVLTEPATVRYAATVTRAGGEVRLLDEPFQRALVFDRTTAVVPAADDPDRAAVISDPATVAMIVANFERDWSRAERVSWHSLLDSAPTRTAVDQVGRLLAQGLTQKAIATRLGLSERTVAAHIAHLRERYDAETLFQLGWLMRRGKHDA
ncbi:helix-turn-helix transcriptional regulator [Kitasatospora cineracea]|uniref:helix-turn-helix transcriptional regulator n=1 Tax=Kitasatospora cineracea TaxID=88074 RepID=UPI0033FAF9C7